MRIKNVITGVESNERNDIARALIRQGMCVAVPNPQLKPDFIPRWSIGEDNAGFVVIQMFVPCLGQTIKYSGKPDFIRPGTFMGHTPPDEILLQYAHIYSNPAKRDQIAAQHQVQALKPTPDSANVKMAKLGRAAEEKARERAEAFQPGSPDGLCPCGTNATESAKETQLDRKKQGSAPDLGDDELEEISNQHVSGLAPDGGMFDIQRFGLTRA
jgi:hypothetical protein